VLAADPGIELHRKPNGGSQLAIASASTKARYTFSGFAAITRCRRMLFGMASFLSFNASYGQRQHEWWNARHQVS
jgi:hypothetical protein